MSSFVIVFCLLVLLWAGASLLFKRVFSIGDPIETGRGKRFLEIHRAMKKAVGQKIGDAVSSLGEVDIVYDSRRRAGKRFVVPRQFWHGSLTGESLQLRVNTLLTIANDELTCQTVNHQEEVIREMVTLIARQLTKRPGLAVNIFCELVRCTDRNGKFALLRGVMLQLDMRTFFYSFR